MEQLAGKTVVITGAGRGIGAAAAVALVQKPKPLDRPVSRSVITFALSMPPKALPLMIGVLSYEPSREVDWRGPRAEQGRLPTYSFFPQAVAGEPNRGSYSKYQASSAVSGVPSPSRSTGLLARSRTTRTSPSCARDEDLLLRLEL